MKKAPLLLALSVALAATPIASAHPDTAARSGDGPPAHAKAKAKAKVKAPKGALHLVQACVVADAASNGVALKAISVNRHMRGALAGERVLTAGIGEATTIRLVGRARHLPPGSVPRRAPKVGGFADLTAGDRVIVRVRAPRGTAAADLPAALRIVDHGPAKRCAPSETPPPGTEGPAPEL
jgi:hypothetical protein